MRRVSSVSSHRFLLISKTTYRTDESALNGAITLALKTYSHIDGLVLNAATLDPVCRIGSDTPVDAWRTHFDVNFFSLITAVKAALPALRDSELGGRVIFVSSGAAEKGYSGWGPYNAGKAAMNSLNRYRRYVHLLG